MNYLAHTYLSGNNNKLMIGNFIADSVKGNNYQHFDKEIQKGILLHRKIDEFTDNHPLTKQSGALLKPHYHRYSAIVMDIFYDHFLAVNWKKFHTEPLPEFSRRIYGILLWNYAHLPVHIKRILPFMIASNRLNSYAAIAGVEQSLNIMANHTSMPDNAEKAVQVLKNNYNQMESDFFLFFDELQEFVKNVNS